MMTPRLMLFAPVALLAGCWPYLPGPYEDYADGVDPSVEDADLALEGIIAFTELRGSYWGSGDPDGSPLGGYAIVLLTDLEPSTFVQRWSGGVGRCRSTESIGVFSDRAMALDDAGSMTLSGDVDLVLPFISDGSIWGEEYAEGTAVPARDTFTLEPLETQEGELAADPLVTFPRRMSITEPDMTGSEAPVVSSSGFDLRWQGQGAAVVVRITTVDSSGNAMEDVVCGLDGDATSFEVSPDDVSTLGSAAYAVIDVANISEGSGLVADGILNRVDTVYWQTGAVFF